MNSFAVVLSLSGLFLTCLVSTGLLLHRHLQCRQDRPPVAEKLIRSPGERLRRRLDCLNRRIVLLLLGGTLVPLALLLGGLAVAARPLGADHPALVLGFGIGGFVVALASTAWGLHRTLSEHRAVRRALNGERMVAESLAMLVAAGHHVFHDIPTENPDPAFNLHHVIVGPGGILAIETRTLEKRRALPGRKDHEIIFDGEKLIYPWGQDLDGLAPTRAKADWFADWIYQITGRHIPVTPVLTFPGWWVKTTASREVHVHNPRQIAAITRQARSGSLDAQQIELIAAELEIRCRDVEL